MPAHASTRSRLLLVLALVAGGLLDACAGTKGRDAARQGGTLRVVSYNIRHGCGSDDTVDLARTAAALRALAPDLVALQEVDCGVRRSGGVDQAAELGRLLGMHHAFGSFMDYQGGRYGMAFLSRFPILRSHAIRLPPGDEPRIALRIDVAVPGVGELTAVNVHFNWVGDDTLRYAQARALAEQLASIGPRYLVLGDFNDEPGSRTLQLFQGQALEIAKPAAARLTYPAPAPVKEIDFVFASPTDGWRVHEVRAVAETLASDHRPVLAVIEAR
ncbi:MAG: endonuclease/exonuclease/phosphatase family protein [Planctomycetes bacterium]|nr:endonuclease/exonuclease/phosphatase family protein [Planctomycetota bacterium]